MIIFGRNFEIVGFTPLESSRFCATRRARPSGGGGGRWEEEEEDGGGGGGASAAVSSASSSSDRTRYDTGLVFLFRFTKNPLGMLAPGGELEALRRRLRGQEHPRSAARGHKHLTRPFLSFLPLLILGSPREHSCTSF